MNTNFGDVQQVIEAYIPDRSQRRKLEGVRCGMCGLGITREDMAIAIMQMVGIEEQTLHPMHKQCTTLLWELQDDLLEAEGAGSEDEVE